MKKKVIGLSVLLAIYIVAVAIGVLIFLALDPLLHNDSLTIMVADVVATIFVWLMGLIFKTASTYDPYWSIQTIVIYTFLLFRYQNWNLGTGLAFLTILLYSIRLTANFIIGFDSLEYVDWRYKMLKEKTGSFYQIVNLLGICMFPTFVVYTASIPLFIYAQIGTFSYLNLIGLFVILIGTLLELIADLQMKKFIKNRKDRSEVINVGLWKYSRHPNYVGEILVWFGVAMILVISYHQYWFYLLGAIINFLMFVFISIPMEENHMLNYKPTYREYKKTTSALLFLPKRKINNDK